MRKIEKLILHCTGNKPGSGVNAESIRKYHMRERRFKDIGYHFVILEDGTIEKGRPITEPGAHCLRENKHSIGIAYVGGLDSNGKPCDTRTEAQCEAMFFLCAMLEAFIFYEQHESVICFGHYEFSNKPCPCFMVHLWEDEWENDKVRFAWEFVGAQRQVCKMADADWPSLVDRCREEYLLTM